MKTIFSYLPYDIILQVGKYLDYESSINFNRILDPLDRVVHRKFTKQECFEHEVVAQRRTLLITYSRSNYYNTLTMRQRRKNCKIMRDMLSRMRTKRRESVIWKTYQKFYMAVMDKCIEILDPETRFLDHATPYYKKWLAHEAAGLQAELLEYGVPGEDPIKLVQEITIKN